jgi:hypothetical protein
MACEYSYGAYSGLPHFPYDITVLVVREEPSSQAEGTHWSNNSFDIGGVCEMGGGLRGVGGCLSRERCVQSVKRYQNCKV